MPFVALAIAALVLIAMQPSRPEIVLQARELWERWLEKCWAALAQASWGRSWMGWLLAVLGTGVVVQALVLVIAGDSVLLTLLLHAGLLTLALAPLDILELDDEESLRETAVRIVGVVFWYLLLGPLGLIASRLCWSAARGQCWPSVSAQAAEWLWWLPVRILVLSFALVGNFHTAIEPLLRHFADSPAEMPARELVELSVPAALSPLWEDMDGSERMLQGNALLRRAMLALLVLLAIMSIF